MGNSSTPVFQKKWSEASHGISVRRKTGIKGTRMHMHEYFEIEIIVGGKGQNTLNGEMYSLKRGTAYFCLP